MPNKINHQSLKSPTFKSAEANGATMTDPKNLIARENDRESFGQKVSRVPLSRNTESHSRKSLLQRGTSWPCPNKVPDSVPDFDPTAPILQEPDTRSNVDTGIKRKDIQAESLTVEKMEQGKMGGITTRQSFILQSAVCPL